jgi:hypothetical protein
LAFFLSICCGGVLGHHQNAIRDLRIPIKNEIDCMPFCYSTPEMGQLARSTLHDEMLEAAEE